MFWIDYRIVAQFKGQISWNEIGKHCLRIIHIGTLNFKLKILGIFSEVLKLNQIAKILPRHELAKGEDLLISLDDLVYADLFSLCGLAGNQKICLFLYSQTVCPLVEGFQCDTRVSILE